MTENHASCTPGHETTVVLRNELIHTAVSGVIRSCDLVFGATATVLAVSATWLLFNAKAHVALAVALWLFVALNLAWSALNRGRESIAADLLRGVVCLPITAFVYVDDAGLPKLWIPAMMVTVGIALSTGIASRRSRIGIMMTAAYVGTLLTARIIKLGQIDLDAINDALGIALTGTVTSLVGRKLGRMLDAVRQRADEANQQRDRAESALSQLTSRSHELTLALNDLHGEMALRMRAESELRQAQKLEAVGRLAAGVAHEINTPVQFVTDSLDFVHASVTELLDAVAKLEVVARSVLDGTPSLAAAKHAEGVLEAIDLPYLDKNLPKAIGRALDGLSRVSTIVRSMKEFAHPDTEEMQLADINHAVESTLIIARNEYKEVAELETNLGDIPPIRCYVGELNQAILNIVVNAAHAVGDIIEGTGTMGRITVTTRCDGEDVVITIADTGGGIPAEIQPHIFEPFFTTKPVGRGTGQGLAVAHSVVVEKHCGRLSFETEQGKGTAFSLRLPIAGRQEAARSNDRLSA